MDRLHGILAELGIAPPLLHPEREVRVDAQHWIVEEPFRPISGESYELAYGKSLDDSGDEHYIVKHVRIDDATWLDLDTGATLASEFQELPVLAYRVLR